MSRIGRLPIAIPNNVQISVLDREISVKGAKGELSYTLPTTNIVLENKDGYLNVSRKNNNKETKALHGLTRSLLNNMVQGVTEGFEKKIELVGTGYRVKKENKKIILSLGFSHPVEIEEVEGVSFDVEGTNVILVKGIDKHLVGQVSANIRAKRPPEPYKGKGIKYSDEIVRRKAGKTAKA